MVQTNISVSAAGVLRGMHFHRRQADYWCLLEGEVFVALVDLRSGSPTKRAIWTGTFDSGHLRGLYVPPGVAHGFYAVTETSLQYHVDQAFTGEDEFGFAWDDPEASIPWPKESPMLSARDRSNPSLAEVLGDAPAFSP